MRLVLSSDGDISRATVAGVSSRNPAAEAEDPFGAAAEAGIHRIAIPTPFAVGRVNVYLIEDDPLTLVDAGPNAGTSLDELERGVARRGHALQDIDSVNARHHNVEYQQ